MDFFFNRSDRFGPQHISKFYVATNQASKLAVCQRHGGTIAALDFVPVLDSMAIFRSAMVSGSVEFAGNFLMSAKVAKSISGMP